MAKLLCRFGLRHVETLRPQMILIDDRTLANTRAPQYMVAFDNQSENLWTFLCYQAQPSNLPKSSQTCYSLAWYAQPLAVKTRGYFLWSVEYSFVWAQTGPLETGTIFRPGQIAPADLSNNNQITFTRLPQGAFTFTRQKQGTETGTLSIYQDKTIPPKTTAVGIGMSNSAIYAVQAELNAPPIIFKPVPAYFVAFGSAIHQGAAIIPDELSARQQLEYPPNKYTAVATLNPDNTWKIDYSAELPKDFVTELY